MFQREAELRRNLHALVPQVSSYFEFEEVNLLRKTQNLCISIDLKAIDFRWHRYLHTEDLKTRTSAERDSDREKKWNATT